MRGLPSCKAHMQARTRNAEEDRGRGGSGALPSDRQDD